MSRAIKTPRRTGEEEAEQPKKLGSPEARRAARAERAKRRNVLAENRRKANERELEQERAKLMAFALKRIGKPSESQLQMLEFAFAHGPEMEPAGPLAGLGSEDDPTPKKKRRS